MSLYTIIIWIDYSSPFRIGIKRMNNKNRKHPFLIYSLLIHIILLFCLWWYSPTDIAQPDFRPEIVGQFVPIQRITEPKPPEVVKIPTPTRNDNSNEEVEKPPTPTKPTVDINTALLNIDSFEEMAAISERLTQKNVNEPTEDTRDDGEDLHTLRHANITQNPHTHNTTVKVNRDQFTLTSTSKNTIGTPNVDTGTINLEVSATLRGISPKAGAPQIHYGSKRGDAFRAAGMGNTWGGSSGSSGSSTSSGRKVGGIYIKMMQDIAGQLTSATTSDKVDIVFLLDETASMMDNIRGIRAYFDFVFDAFKGEKRDAAYGLVTFTDKVKNYGLTTDFGKFKNLLFKIDVNRGGDMSEAGLDALMDAVNKMQFRRNAQRFFILASDAAFHDADFDGKSQYSLDEVISTLQKEQVRVEVIGLDYLPIKQIAIATGGTWRAIPGNGYLEYVPPITLTDKMLSKLGTLYMDKDTLGDKITVYVNNPPRPKHVTLTWKVLNPLGEKCYGPFSEKIVVPTDTSKYVEFTPLLDSNTFQKMQGIYTVIYRLQNDQGHKSILRRTYTNK